MKDKVKIGDEWEYTDVYKSSKGDTVYHNFRVLILEKYTSEGWSWNGKISYKHGCCHSAYKLGEIYEWNISDSCWKLWKCGTVKKIKG